MIVVDTSIVIKWINRDEEYSTEAVSLRDNHILGKKSIIVPQLLYYEVANTLATKSKSTARDIKEGLQLIYEAHLLKFSESEADIEEASIMAKQYKTTVYDMLYAVIAKKEKTVLITADETFIKKTHLSFVRSIRIHA